MSQQTRTKGRYPTSEEIMAKAVSFREDTLETVMKWKKEQFMGWKQKSVDERSKALQYLWRYLETNYKTGRISTIRAAEFYGFSLEDNVFYFDRSNPSIISTLHEFRHKINGPDETAACRWSIWLFKRCFPKAFDMLEFRPGSHLLIAKQK